MKEQKKYARKCDITGKGMNEGWVWGDGVFYTSTEELTLKECRKDREHIINAIKNLGCELDELDTVYDKTDLNNLKQAIERANKDEDTNEDLLLIGYNADYLYYTEWDEIDEDLHYLEDGTEIETNN